jgi:hypothetical protein
MNWVELVPLNDRLLLQQRLAWKLYYFKIRISNTTNILGSLKCINKSARKNIRLSRILHSSNWNLNFFISAATRLRNPLFEYTCRCLMINITLVLCSIAAGAHTFDAYTSFCFEQIFVVRLSFCVRVLWWMERERRVTNFATRESFSRVKE